ncbi:MAG: membrane protein insertase YidC, partial [Candidatus Calescibacterium sp.]|nr:membrane protein insertase YidC [Candidatus Calescibacterium sp.]
AGVMETKELAIPSKSQVKLSFDFYVSSKQQLAELDKNFASIDDYGFWAPVSHFLLWILNIFYQLTNNYGVAIILLTLAIKLALYPLSKRQQVYMYEYQSKMKKFQPELMQIQKKYKNDRKRQHEEMMRLYKEHKINPVPIGGCLPILLQLPILIGLYSAICYSIVLRQAEFLWIKDLSQPDALFDGFNLLPILMTIVWFIQMKTQPLPDDPNLRQQQKIMLFMPFIFGFMFYSMASGLILYWFVMQLISIVEQWIIKKSLPKS